MVDVAVCVVTHNARDVLVKCLTKLDEIMPTNLTVQTIVVDNTGEDGSDEIVKQKWPNVQLVINSEPKGFGENVNLAASLSHARYLLIINPDVLLSHDSIQTLVDYLDKNPDVAVCAPKALYPDGQLQTTCRQFPNWSTVFWRWLKLDKFFQPSFYRRFLMLNWDHNQARAVDWVMGCCFLVRSDVFNNIGGFDESFFLYYEDIDFCRRVWQTGYSVHYVPMAEVIHFYQRHSGRSLINALALVHLTSILRYRRKHGMAVGQFIDKRYSHLWLAILVLGDVFISEVALGVARYLRLYFPILGAYPYPNVTPLNTLIYFIVPIIWLGVFFGLNFYRIAELRNFRVHLRRLITGVLISGLILAGTLYALFLYEVYIPRLLLVYFMTTDAIFLAIFRVFLKLILSKNGLVYLPRTLLVGDGRITNDILKYLRSDHQPELDLIAITPWISTAVEDYPMHVTKMVEQLNIDTVILAPPYPSPQILFYIVEKMQGLKVDIKLILDSFNNKTLRMDVYSFYEFWSLDISITNADNIGRMRWREITKNLTQLRRNRKKGE